MAKVLKDTTGWTVRDNELKRYWVSPEGKAYRTMRKNTTFPGKPDLIYVSKGKWGTEAGVETWLKELGPRQAAEALPSLGLTPRTVEPRPVKKTAIGGTR